MNGFQWINIFSNEPWPAMATWPSQLRWPRHFDGTDPLNSCSRRNIGPWVMGCDYGHLGHNDPTDPRFDVFSHWHFWVDFWWVKDNFSIFSGSPILLVGEINHTFPGGDLIDVRVAAQHCVTIRQCLCAHFEPDSPGITGDIIRTRAQQAANKPMVLFQLLVWPPNSTANTLW